MNPTTFADRTDRTAGPRACWPWTGAIRRDGYGHINVNGRDLAAHRYAYACSVGPIPPGALVLHSCNNRRCVNPAHLRLGDHAANYADRRAAGAIDSRPRLDRTAAAAIRTRHAAGETARALAEAYAVPVETVKHIISLRYYRPAQGA